MNRGGGSCSETQNWLTLSPMVRNAAYRKRRWVFISCTFKLNDVWRRNDGSTLFQTVMPFCGNGKALAESLAASEIFITDGALHPSSDDLRAWVERILRLR